MVRHTSRHSDPGLIHRGLDDQLSELLCFGLKATVWALLSVFCRLLECFDLYLLNLGNIIRYF